MTNRRTCFLAPEIPSISATFVYREVLALRRMGLDVSCLSMKSVEVDGLSVDALPFLSETDNIYGS
ncbi:MAG: hypothetical protein ACI97A_004126, partial [Planctomycetota bacterium]